ncbi:hypothetical protein FHX52_0815 [Humibacillus xanthopallidus]|uniref:Uncharacterized protein n=1 Tax=Humibacillus xanthopallidus TaxID=412689 RepID=A0A543PUF7_9MICO|nr:hypothetical protein [Humibacillus xanthopallidus]TQN47705.1 hypothetical protein FHX52_0815 [Humibacillus xanthopallidus]
MKKKTATVANLPMVRIPEELPVPRPEEATDAIYNQMKQDVLLNLAASANATQVRIGEAFRGAIYMLWALFAVGIVSFSVSVFMGLTADDTADAVAAVGFGGISAGAFVSIFLTGPAERMELAGPRTAWLQTMISTYWLRVVTDKSLTERDMRAVQDRFNDTMRVYLTSMTRSHLVEDELEAASMRVEIEAPAA